MPITTLAQVKLILGISGNTQDALITALIPLVEKDYISIRNRPFDEGTTLQITAGAAASGNVTVTIDGAALPVVVIAGDTAAQVARKAYNALRGGYLYMVTIAGDTLTLVSKQSSADIVVVFTDTGATGVTAVVSEYIMLYPEGAESTAIDMIAYRLSKQTPGIASQSLGDHSVSYEPSKDKYPATVTGGIKRFVGWL